MKKPKVLTFVRYYLPGFRAGGPTKTIANMIEVLGDEYDFYLIASSRDLGSNADYKDMQLGVWNCKNKYIREEELIEELFKVIDKVSINELGMRIKLEDEIKRFNRLQRLATKGTPKYSINEDDVNTREYAKYVLREGTPLEKRELMGHLRSRLVLKDKKITLLKEDGEK